jgi:hypothetical protein
MGEEILGSMMALDLGSEPALHPVNLGIESIVWRMNNAVHPIQVDQGKHSENIRPVERIASEGADLIQATPEIPMSKANGAKPVCLPLPGDEMLDGQFLRLAFAKHDNAAHVFSQRV